FKPGSTGAERGPGYYYVGDSLPKPDDNIAVFAIRDGGVEFSFADDEREREFLLPPSVSDRVIERVASLDDVKRRAERLNFEASVAAARGDADANAQTEKVNGVFQIGPGDANTFAQDYQRILSEDVSLQTYRDPETGKKAGIKVSSVRPGSIAARHGAMDGDIIISINGDSVTSEQQAMQYVRERSDQTDVWRVRYIRAGQEREEVYHSPDN
ncbi:MAG: PDZ domain-containing protein, partial [Planctomycetota bacterium]